MTPKANDIYLTRLCYNDILRQYLLACSTYTIDVASISDKLVDSKSGTATVKYTLKRTPTEYAKRLIQIDPAFAKNVEDQYFEVEKTVHFRHWDSGWRLEEDQ